MVSNHDDGIVSMTVATDILGSFANACDFILGQIFTFTNIFLFAGIVNFRVFSVWGGFPIILQSADFTY